MPQDQFDVDKFMRERRKPVAEKQPAATEGSFDVDTFMQERRQPTRPKPRAYIPPTERQEFGRRPPALDQGVSRFTFNRPSPAPQVLTPDQPGADFAAADIEQRRRGEAERRYRAQEKKPLLTQLGEQARTYIAEGGGTLSKMARQTAEAGAGVARGLQTGNFGPGPIESWGRYEAGRNPELEAEVARYRPTAQQQIARGIISSAPVAGAAGLLTAATGGSLPAAMAVGGGLGAAGADWQDPRRALTQTAIGAVAPVLGGMAGQRIGGAVANRLTQPLAQAAARAGGEVLGGGAGNVLATGAEQLAFDRRLNVPELIKSGIVGGALSAPGAVGAASRRAEGARAMAPLVEGEVVPEVLPPTEPLARTPRGAIIAQPSTLYGRKLLPPASTQPLQYPEVPVTQEMPAIRRRITAENAPTAEIPSTSTEPEQIRPTARFPRAPIAPEQVRQTAELPRVARGPVAPETPPEPSLQPTRPIPRLPQATDENIQPLRDRREELGRIAYDRRGDFTGDLRDEFDRLNSIIREYDLKRAPREIGEPPGQRPEKPMTPEERSRRRAALQQRTGPMPETLTEGRKITQEFQVPGGLKPSESFASREDARQGHFEQFDDAELIQEIGRLTEERNKGLRGQSKLSRAELEANNFDLKIAVEMQKERGYIQRQMGREAGERIATRAPGLPPKKVQPPRAEAAPPVAKFKAEDIPQAGEHGALDKTSLDIETRFRHYLADNFDEAVTRYREKFGKEINTDNARELSEDYARSDEARSLYSSAVHEPSSWFAKELYKLALKEKPKPGEEPMVLFTAGGTGAGKTSTLASSTKMDTAVRRSQIIMDGNLNNPKNAIQKINQALAAGKKVTVAAVYRDPIEAWVNGVLPRAEKRGRAVPVNAHIATHSEMRQSLIELAAHYANDPRVEIGFMDNTHGMNNARDANIDIFREISDTKALRERLVKETKEAYAKGRISQRVLAGSLGGGEVSPGAEEVGGRPAVSARVGQTAKLQPVPQGRPRPPDTARAAEDLRRGVPEPVAPGRRAGGDESTLTIPRGEDRPVRYEVRELADLQPSHDPFTFQKNPKYPYVNDRDYTSPANRTDVEENTKAGKFKPPLVINDDPTAAGGPPIIRDHGAVLGGNSRTMMIARIYKNHPQDAQKYKDLLTKKAAGFGIAPGELANFKEPVLVRVDQGAGDTQKLITGLNIMPGKAMTSTEAASARAKSMSVETLDFLASRLAAEGPEGTLANALEGAKGVRVINRLIEDGVIPAGERNRYLSDQGNLSPAAKTEIEQMLLGRVFRDQAQMKATPPEMRNKLVRVAPQLGKMAGTEWDITGLLPNAIEAARVAKEQKLDLEMLNRRGNLFGEGVRYSPEELAIAGHLKDKGPAQIEKVFKRYAAEFESARAGRGLFGEPPSQKEAFKDVFQPENGGHIMGGIFGGLQPLFKGARLPGRAEVSETVGGLQTAAQLGNPRFVIRNILQNFTYGKQERAATRLAASLDWAFSKFTGKPRQITQPGGSDLAAYVRNWRRAVRAYKAGQPLPGGATPLQHTASANKIDKAVTKLMTWINEIPDSANWQTRFDDSLISIVEASTKSKSKLNVTDAIDQATAEANRAALRDPNFASRALLLIKQGLNKASSPIFGTDQFGAGDFLVKYAQTPGALLKRGLERSPLGLFQVAKEAATPGPCRRRNTLLALSRVTEGAVTGVGLGAALGAAGVLIGPEEESKTTRTMEREEGVKGYSLNASALGRLMTGESTEMRTGDNLYSIDWLQPWAMNLSAGAALSSLYKQGKLGVGRSAEAAGQAVYDSLSKTLDIMGDQSVLKNMSRYLDKAQGETFSEKFLNFAKAVGLDVPSSFVPSSLRAARQVMDPFERDVRPEDRRGVGGFAKEAAGRALAQIPGISERFATRPSLLTGEARKTALGEMSVPARVAAQFSPANESTYTPRPVAREISRLNRAGEKVSVEFPRPKKGEMTSDQIGRAHV